MVIVSLLGIPSLSLSKQQILVIIQITKFVFIGLSNLTNLEPPDLLPSNSTDQRHPYNIPRIKATSKTPCLSKRDFT